MKKILSLILICLFINPSMVANAGNDADITQLKTYLRSIKSAAIDFTQEDTQGTIVEGKLLISKPYKFRCNYYPPCPLVIIGSKNFVSLYDYDMEQVSRINRSENVFNFLLEDNNHIDKDFVFESVVDEGNNLKITIYHNITQRHSEIIFDKTTKQIKGLKIFEDNNVVTITFDKIAEVRKFDEDLFKLKNPEIFGPPDRLTKSEIEKKYIVSFK
ncbi:MAG TPA: outer membrane lipoprotein carrier protein LolA [Rickettsia endosymbiont of Pyrocoelia pectoralis]|nr:outer membrane lipoprotein carrier protein LolA [Rickettsia endosymbiont of Pyrocoelia pectoralis]